MIEFLRRAARRPLLTTEVVLASLFANVLVLASPLYVIQVLNRYVSYGVDATLATLTAGALIALVLEFLFRTARNRLIAGLSAEPDRRYAQGAFNVLAGAKVGPLERVGVGLRQEMMGAAKRIEAAYAGPNLTALFDLPFALLFIGAIYLIKPVLALIVAVFAAAVLLVGIALQAALKGPARALVESEAAETSLAASAINGADALRAFNARPLVEKAWSAHYRLGQRLRRRVAANRALVQSFSQSANVFMTVAVIAVGAKLVVAGELDVGAMIGVNILAVRALGPIARFVALGDAFARARQGMTLLRDFSRLPAEAREGSVIAGYKGGLEFKDAAFAYPAETTPLFESLSLRVPPGGRLVVTGGNGAGKTTLARLILGLIEPTRGQILADGVDLRQLLPEWWRRQVAYLPQEPVLLNASVRDNLLTVNPGLDLEGLNRVVREAGLRRWLDQSPRGFETVLTDNGRHLSLGLRRRMALARAFASAGALVVFDEPTEGLDAEGSAAVYAALNRFAEAGRTIVAISHDPNIVKVGHQVVDLNLKPVPRVSAVAPPREAAPRAREGAARAP